MMMRALDLGDYMPCHNNENELYEFCLDNTRMLLDGSLGWDKIEKLRGIGFDFNYYIDELIQERGGQCQ